MRLEKNTLFWPCLRQNLEISILKKDPEGEKSFYRFSVSCYSWETQKLCFKEFNQYFLKQKRSTILGKFVKTSCFHYESPFPSSTHMGKMCMCALTSKLSTQHSGLGFGTFSV